MGAKRWRTAAAVAVVLWAAWACGPRAEKPPEAALTPTGEGAAAPVQSTPGASTTGPASPPPGETAAPPAAAPRPPGGKDYALLPAGRDYQLALKEGVALEGASFLDGHRALAWFYETVPGALSDGGLALIDLNRGAITPARNIGQWWFFSPFLWDERTVASLHYAGGPRCCEVGQFFALTDLETGETRARWPLGEYVLAIRRQPGAAQVAYSLRHADHQQQHLGALRALDVATGRSREIAPVGWPVGFLADGRLLFHRGERAGELAAVALAEGARPQVIHPDAFAAAIAPDGSRVAFLTAAPPAAAAFSRLFRPSVAHASPTRIGAPPNPQVNTLAVWDLATGRLQTQPLPFPAYLYGLYWSADSQDVAAVMAEVPLEKLHRDASRRSYIALFGRREPLVESQDRQIQGLGWREGRFYFRYGAAAGENEPPRQGYAVTREGARHPWPEPGTAHADMAGGYAVFPAAGGMQVHLFGQPGTFSRAGWPPPAAEPVQVRSVSAAGWALVAQGQGASLRYSFVHLDRR